MNFLRWQRKHPAPTESPPLDDEVLRLAEQADAILAELDAVVTRMSTMLREEYK